MKTFKDTITLSCNNRGCYIIDTIKGCSICKKEKPRGCYDNCYAKGIADRYGIDFSNFVKRNFHVDKKQLYILDFIDESHLSEIVKKIKMLSMPFVRIGEMGDPSEDWGHTISICKAISIAKKPIVIITKHWNVLTENQLKELETYNICINTSISALDSQEEIEHRLKQYERIKSHCKSVLRIVSCDFNKENSEGLRMSKIQDTLFKNKNVIDTVFRPNIHNELVIKKIINTKRIKFLGSYVLASIFNEKTYFGYCDGCPDMCGINL